MRKPVAISKLKQLVQHYILIRRLWKDGKTYEGRVIKLSHEVKLKAHELGFSKTTAWIAISQIKRRLGNQ